MQRANGDLREAQIHADGRRDRVPHAMRPSTSGTVIHGDYWAPDSVFGHVGVSHGCVGLDDVRGGGEPTHDAAWFYENSLIGGVEHSRDHAIVAR
ncbi:L,D-transpeptidase family protein [Streptomyces sp. 900105755]